MVESTIQSGVIDNVQSPGFAVNSVSATERKYLGSTSLQVFSQWLDMTFHIAPTGLTSSFQHAQALLLICLALRGRNKDGAGSQALGQAIRILHTLGLHRRLNGYGKLDQEQTESLRLGIQIWWSAYCLDRMMSLETGRPPQVQDEDIDQSRDLQTTGVQDLAPLQALLDLASIQGSVCRHLYRALIDWQNKLPAQLRCDGDITINGSDLALPRAFLSIQFHTTMINLHRAALLMDKEIHQTNLARYDLRKTNASRLASSESICANSARAIITAFLQARDITDHSRLQTMTGPLMAIYVLSISTLKNATSWSARSDLGLIHSAAEAVEQRYTADGQDPGFYTLLKTLKQFASRDTLSPNGLTNSRAPTRRTSPHANQSHIALQGGSASRDHDLGAPHLGHEQDPNLSDEWNLLFPRLYVGDFALDTGAFEGMDIEHLMGIPHLSFDEPH
ncbi:hypothetical protein KCU93_g3511, partial [Aureobasidium melanogenum]